MFASDIDSATAREPLRNEGIEVNQLADVPRYRVFADDRLALEIRGDGGVLVSMSAPPPLPGTSPVRHPFATASFRMAENEGELGRLLREAADLQAFLDAVRDLGFRVEPVDGPEAARGA